jgi:hypothetical protein
MDALGPLNEADYARACERARQKFGLNQLQAEAFVKACREGRNLFLTGGAGVGKSHTAHKIIDHLHGVLVANPEVPGDPIGIVAPTGTAAQIASTRTTRAWTLHRFFCIRGVNRQPGSYAARARGEPTDDDIILMALDAVPEEVVGNELETACLDSNAIGRLRALQFLVIDEISMVDSNMLQAINDGLRLARASSELWGGVKVLACGDLFQLAPVSDDPVWCFESPLWPSFQEVELTEVVRQGDDAEFAEALARMRKDEMVPGDIRYLNNRSCHDVTRKAEFHLMLKNKDVEKANDEALTDFPGELHTFPVKKELDEIISVRPFDREPYDAGPRLVDYPREHPKGAWPLTIKQGAPVQCTKNVYLYSGGKADLVIARRERGVVLRLPTENDDTILVRWNAIGLMAARVTEVHRARKAKRQTWESEERGNPVVASLSYFPLKPSFASTIHSAQGMTIDCSVDVNVTAWNKPNGRWLMSRPALAYVAISRATKLSHIRFVMGEKLQSGHVHLTPKVAARYQLP